MAGQGSHMAMAGAYVPATELGRQPGDATAAFAAYERSSNRTSSGSSSFSQNFRLWPRCFYFAGKDCWGEATGIAVFPWGGDGSACRG